MQLGHVGLAAKDPVGLANFYEQFLGLRKVAEAMTKEGGAIVFLSTDEKSPPALQLLSNLEARHVAFKVDSLAELRRLYDEAPSRGGEVVMSLDHGPTFSVYVRDPEGNVCEVYWETGRTSNGANRPIDLTKSDEELLAPSAMTMPRDGVTPRM